MAKKPAKLKPALLFVQEQAGASRLTPIYAFWVVPAYKVAEKTRKELEDSVYYLRDLPEEVADIRSHSIQGGASQELRNAIAKAQSLAAIQGYEIANSQEPYYFPREGFL